MPPRRLLTLSGLAVALGTYIAVALWTQIVVNPRFVSDIDIYLRAGQKALQAQNAYQPFEIGKSFVYPPPALLIFAPLSLLSWEAAIGTWAVANITAYLGALACLWYAIQPVERRVALGLWAAMLLFTPFLETVTVGQVNGLVLLGLAVFALGSVEPRWQWPGDVGLAAAVLIKISPAILIALPLVRRDWARCARVALATGLLCAASLAFGLRPWRDFAEIAPLLFRGYPDKINQAISPTVQWLWPGLNIAWLGPALSLAFLVVWVAVLLWRRPAPGPPDVLSLGVATLTISSSLIWFHHLTFLAFPILNGLTSKVKLIWLLTALGFGLVHVDRLVEGKLSVPPLASITGYLLIYAAAWVNVWRREAPIYPQP
jgi:hypothetical protein